MEVDNDYAKLSVEDRCAHKVWKARLSGYEDASKVFQQIDDEKSLEWNKYIPMIKKFVIDPNAFAQEKGLEAVLAFVENCGAAGKTAGDVLSGLVQKCVGAPKAKTKELALQICLMYIEIGKQETVIDELLKGTENKNPKIIASCISILTQSLRVFGPKIVNISKLMKRIPTLLEEREALVRAEGKTLLIEIFRWMGQAIRPQLSSLKQSQLADAEPEFEKVKNENPEPSRLVRSEQAKKQQPQEDGRDSNDGNDGEETGIEEIDPLDHVEPVDILGTLSKDFFTQLEAKKWSERKDALEILEKSLSDAPEINNGDYSELIKALKKTIVKDSNVAVVQVAIKCITGLANGLKKKFYIYSGVLISCLLEKFKEKKQNIVIALREAVDAIYPSTSLEQLLEDILIALESKNPAMKAETVSFLARCFTKCTPAILNKKLLKSLSQALLKALNESDPVVRDNAALALGTAMKVVGEKGMAPYLGELDNVKMGKVKECCEKAELKEEPMVKKNIQTGRNISSHDFECKQTTEKAKKVTQKSKIHIHESEGFSKSSSASSRYTSSVDSLEGAELLLPEIILEAMKSSDTKEQQSAIQHLTRFIETTDSNNQIDLAILRVITFGLNIREPDPIFFKNSLSLLGTLSASQKIPVESLGFLISTLFKYILDSEKKEMVIECMVILSQATSFEAVAHSLLQSETITGNSVLWAYALNWISDTLMKTGASIDVQFLMEEAKKALAQNDHTIRNAGLALFGTMHLQAEVPFLNMKGNTSESVSDRVLSGKIKMSDVEGKNSSCLNEKAHMSYVEDSAKVVDIQPLITYQLLSELGDKSWKIRAEALNKLSIIVKDSGKIAPDIGDVPQLLASRIADSNTKISVSAVSLVETIIHAMGPPIKQYTKVFLPPLLRIIGDSKPWVRVAVFNCINALGNTSGYKEFFENEIFAEALKIGTTTNRVELWNWLAEKLPQLKSIPKDELLACLPILYSNLEDRSAEVRKSAGESIQGFMIHLGYSTMASQAENMKNGGGVAVKAALEKARGTLPPEKSPPKQRNNADKTVRSNKLPLNTYNTITKSTKPKGIVKGVTQRKKDDDIDTSPLLQVNNLKHQRAIDEQKMKTLRWNFTSPRPEFVELLRDQMIAANLNKTLIGNMFNVDFKYHLRAIEALSEDLAINRPALMCNLDLILRWMTLRFFDTNPSVLLKGLEYLNSVFVALIEEEYNMLDNEAASFFPYLILKIGDPKDVVRNSVRALFRQIGAIYPVSKQFSFVMDGLKSKNARQRSECLDQLSWLIENYGVIVCHPSPSVALKEIAKHIADRDTAVRNSALNCVVTAFFLEGEKVMKMVGQISEKDMSLLEERIKRAAKNRPVASVKPLQASVSPPQSPPPQGLESGNVDGFSESFELQETPQDDRHSLSGSSNILSTSELIPENEDPTSPRENNQNSADRSGTGPYVLDPNVLNEIEQSPSHYTTPSLVDIDLQFLSSTAHGTINFVQLPKVTPSLSKFSQPAAIKWELTLIASTDIEKAMQSMAQIDTILNSDKRNHLLGFIDFMVGQLVQQLIILNQSTHPDLVNCYRANFSLLMKLCNYRDLCQNISEGTLYKVLEQLLLLLTEHRFETVDRNDMFIKVVNSLVIRLLESTNKTNIQCALIKMLYDTVKNTSTSKHHQDLVIKCLWKLNRNQPEWDSELNYARVLTEIHIFLRDFPTAWWKNQPDVPLRTVKTMLHQMVKLRGVEIKIYMKSVQGLPLDSELTNYIRRLIKHLKVENQQTGKDSDSSLNIPSIRLSKETHDELSESLRMIGDTEESSEGIRRLAAFKKAHPEVDVGSFIAKANPVFQHHIKSQLDALEINQDDTIENVKKHLEEKKQKKVNLCDADLQHPCSESEKNVPMVLTSEAALMWNKLQLLQEQAGCKDEDNSQNLHKENEYNVFNARNMAQEGHPEHRDSQSTPIDSIKQRLEFFKNIKQ